MTELISSEQPKARINHHCDSCGRVIMKGEKYERHFCSLGGETWTWKAHLACHKAAEILHKQGIEGEDGSLMNVHDMDSEYRQIVYQADPKTYHTVWPDAPIPGQPELVQ